MTLLDGYLCPRGDFSINTQDKIGKQIESNMLDAAVVLLLTGDQKAALKLKIVRDAYARGCTFATDGNYESSILAFS